MTEAHLTGAFTSGTTKIAGHGGAQIEAYTALVADPAPRGGVVVIHHMPGYDDATK
jgi:carboxymethylenebutenolidase